MADIQDTHYYFIIPKCCEASDPLLVMGMNGHQPAEGIYTLGPVQLMKGDKKDPRTVWRAYESHPGDGTWFLLNNAFLGNQTGILTAPDGDSPVVVQPEQEVDWQGKDPAHTFRAILQSDGTWCALQLVENIKQNLNVAGNGPYPEGTPIYVYHWCGGDPNELWRLEDVGY